MEVVGRWVDKAQTVSSPSRNISTDKGTSSLRQSQETQGLRSFVGLCVGSPVVSESVVVVAFFWCYKVMGDTATAIVSACGCSLVTGGVWRTLVVAKRRGSQVGE